LVARGDSSDEEHAEEREHGRGCEQPRRFRSGDADGRRHVLDGSRRRSDRHRSGSDPGGRRTARGLRLHCASGRRRPDCSSSPLGQRVLRMPLGAPRRLHLSARRPRARRGRRGRRRRADLRLRARRPGLRFRRGPNGRGTEVWLRRGVYRRGHGGRRRRRGEGRSRNRRRGYRSWLGRSHLRHRAHRQEGQRVEISLRVVCPPHAEVDIRHVYLGIAGWANRPDRLPLGHAVAVSDCDRAEVEQRDRVIVRCSDRHRTAVPRQPAGEGDVPAHRRVYGRPRFGADIDARVAVLAVLGPSEREPAQHRPVRRPAPSARDRWPDQSERDQQQRRPGCCLSRQHRWRR
jgi:hypothetical protein